MRVPTEWEADDATPIRRMLDIVRTKDKPFKQAMAELMDQGLVYEKGDCYGITEKGATRLQEDCDREEDALREAAQNFGSMTWDERSTLLSRAATLYFPNAPSEISQDELNEVFWEILERLGIKHVSVH